MRRQHIIRGSTSRTEGGERKREREERSEPPSNKTTSGNTGTPTHLDSRRRAPLTISPPKLRKAALRRTDGGMISSATARAKNDATNVRALSCHTVSCRPSQTKGGGKEESRKDGGRNNKSISISQHNFYIHINIPSCIHASGHDTDDGRLRRDPAGIRYVSSARMRACGVGRTSCAW